MNSNQYKAFFVYRGAKYARFYVKNMLINKPKLFFFDRMNKLQRKIANLLTRTTDSG
ncbi:MAG: hypothetical protein LEGION0403_FIIPPAGN_01475 [Legionella sp.]|uniref:hypothetical protein n=1 Tax=Legionella sp. TaxID=459 RepID=UPI003D1279A7